MPAGSVGKVKRGGGIRERIFADENHIFRAGPFPATQAVVIQIGTDLTRKVPLSVSFTDHSKYTFKEVSVSEEAAPEAEKGG